MFKFLKKSKQTPSTISTLGKLNETLEMLEKKESLLQRKISVEIERAREFTRSKNKRAAIQCLKRKKQYETQMETLGNFQLRIHDQMITLEGAKATTETVDTLRMGASAIKSIQQSLKIDDIDKTLEEVNEHTESMKQIQEALAAPIGATADIDEDELEAELDELEGAELEEELLQPANRNPVISPPPAASTLPKTATPAQSTTKADDEELAALQAEMAL